MRQIKRVAGLLFVDTARMFHPPFAVVRSQHLKVGTAQLLWSTYVNEFILSYLEGNKWCW